jgi:hypothetical protein
VAGAGDALLSLLGPAILSFALSIYWKRRLLLDNAR